MRIALGIEYNGASYAGWQSQAHGNTVQDALENALAAIAGVPVRVICAGRTDAGVHALEQVVHFDVNVVRPNSAWVRGVNAHLPPSIVVIWAVSVIDEFHARFSAISRSYRYLLLNRSVRPAILNDRVGWYHGSLDVEAMRSAASCLIGSHDFSAFRAAECQAKSPVKVVEELVISRQNDVICFDITANAFLHHMVRNIVGALVYVGKGKYPVSWLAQVLEGRDRAMAAPTFEAAGLYLVHVGYDARWQLPQQRRIMPSLSVDIA